MFFALYFTGVQSILFAIVIEFVVPRYTSNISISVIFGLLYGYITGLSVSYILSQKIELYSVLGFIGAITGALVGFSVAYSRGDRWEQFSVKKIAFKKAIPRPIFVLSLSLGIITLAIINPEIDADAPLPVPIYVFAFTIPWYILIRFGVFVYKLFQRENNGVRNKQGTHIQ